MAVDGAGALAAAAIVTQPNDSMKKLMGQEDREWHAHGAGCLSDCKGSCLMCWCPCVFQCLLAKRMRENPCVPWFVPGGLVAMRTRLRSKLDIKGSICRDCCCGIFCGPCAACQMSRELDHLGFPNLPILMKQM